MPCQPLIGLTLGRLEELARELGLPRFKAGQIARRIYGGRATSIDQLTGLSLAERHRLSDAGYCIGREAPLAVQRSVDGTVKYAFAGTGGRAIESVMIPDADRATLCVSSQAGCRMGCRFCATGRGGFQGQLSAAQIINQVLSVENSAALTNIVFMGMGEPMDNIDAVLDAIDILTAPWGLAMSPRRITVSTVGHNLTAMRRLLDTTQVHVALSLHLPSAPLRSEMMPANRALPLERVLDLLRGLDWSHQRRLSIEYIMWDGLNDRPRDASLLARMLRGIHCRVNLIPYHEIGVEGLHGTPHERMVEFRDRLNALGITSTIRTSRGLDIDAACGQLSGRKPE